MTIKSEEGGFKLIGGRPAPYNKGAPVGARMEDSGGATGVYIADWWSEIQPKMNHLPVNVQLAKCREYLRDRASDHVRLKYGDDFCPPECTEQKQDPKGQSVRSLVGTSLEKVITQYLILSLGEETSEVYIKPQDCPCLDKPDTKYDLTLETSNPAYFDLRKWFEIKASICGDRRQAMKWQCRVAMDCGVEFVVIYGLDYKGNDVDFSGYRRDGLKLTTVCFDTEQIDEFLERIKGIREMVNR